MLIKYREDINKQIDKAINDVKQGYKYCPECKEYYKEKAWEIEHKTEKRNVCTYHDAGYGDDDIYEDKTCFITYEICPMGHVIEKNVTL